MIKRIKCIYLLMLVTLLVGCSFGGSIQGGLESQTENTSDNESESEVKMDIGESSKVEVESENDQDKFSTESTEMDDTVTEIEESEEIESEKNEERETENVGSDEKNEPLWSIAELNKTMYAKASVNVRKGPGQFYDKIGTLSKNEEIKVFMISLKAGGTGLNLVGADMVIHLDPWWNVSAENQATDRAHRIGQTRNVHVLKLVCKDTIEEKVLLLQKAKQELANSVISSDVNKKIKLTKEDILQMLE